MEKKVTVPTSDSFKKIKNLLNDFCYSPYSKESLPFGVLFEENKIKFLEGLEIIYSTKQISEISKLISEYSGDIVFALINGFKPGGGDSRPDRGVLPFIRMLFGDNILVVTIIYGPVSEHHLKKFKDNDYLALSNKNGLFSAIFTCTDYLIVDTIENGNLHALFIKNSIKTENMCINSSLNFLKNQIIELPIKIGENDVDTLIHMYFEHGFNNVFESFSNPPGGDWSGISIFENNVEYRWTSLPREPKGVKRPDHIFQIDSNILLSIESKDYYNTLLKKENNVGPRMISYLKDLLFVRPINSYRNLGEKYYHKCNESININHFTQLTAVAFISKSDKDISLQALKKLKAATVTDLVLGIKVNSISDIKVYFYSSNDKITCLLESKENYIINNFDVVSLINVEK